MEQQPLAILVGPTAIGKTKVSIDYAKRLNAEIISADSMQVYRYMDVGTAKITLAEMDNIPHHLIDVVTPDTEFSVADYQNMARTKIAEISFRGRLPFVVGGTGLYISSIIDNLDFTEIDTDWDFRNKLKAEAKQLGNLYLHKQLAEIDPAAAAKIHPNDLRRTIRAIEVYHKTGQPISHYQALSRLQPSPYQTMIFGLIMPRDLLYARIEQRIELMLADGLVAEVEKLLKMGYQRNLVSMQGLGYKEIIGYLDGAYDYLTAVDLLKKNTRHLAKRQLTWFRRDPRIYWIDVTVEEPLTAMLQKTAELLNIT